MRLGSNKPIKTRYLHKIQTKWTNGVSFLLVFYFWLTPYGHLKVRVYTLYSVNLTFTCPKTCHLRYYPGNQSNQWNWTNKVPFFVQTAQTKTKTFEERVRNQVSDLPVVYPPLEDLNSLLIHLFTNKNSLFTVQSVIICDHRPHWT